MAPVEKLVQSLLREKIRDPKVLEAFRQVPREKFVPAVHAARAYDDEPLPIGHAQVTTQPSLVAHMVEALELRGPERVLEVGTGLGFQTAILATLCHEVHSIEWFADLARKARQNLHAAGIRNAFVTVGDGSLGIPRYAPYDAIVTSAAAPEVPPPLVDQLAEGGRLVHPLGPGGAETVVAYSKRAGMLVIGRYVVGAYFVPMVGTHGATGGVA